MEEKIYNLALKINKLVKADSNFQKLQLLDDQLNNDEEVMKLSYIKDVCCVKYSDALKIYSENSEEVNLALKELNEAKINLDNNVLVKEYLKTYSEVKKILFEMNSILFKDIISECN